MPKRLSVLLVAGVVVLFGASQFAPSSTFEDQEIDRTGCEDGKQGNNCG